NTQPAVNVLHAVADHRPRARVVLVSSSAVYAPRSAENGPILESAELRPVLAYGRAKVAVEQAGRTWTARDGGSSVIRSAGWQQEGGADYQQGQLVELSGLH